LPVTPLDANAVAGGALAELDVLVVPSAQPQPWSARWGWGPRPDHVVGAERRVLITLDGATAWLASERLGLSRLRVRVDSACADSAGAGRSPPTSRAPSFGSLPLLSPLLAGVQPKRNSPCW
jgi:hypothetical protein